MQYQTMFIFYMVEPGAYGVVSHMRGVRVGINTYINGFLREENVRFRKQPIVFDVKPPAQEIEAEVLADYSTLKKSYKGFFTRGG